MLSKAPNRPRGRLVRPGLLPAGPPPAGPAPAGPAPGPPGTFGIILPKPLIPLNRRPRPNVNGENNAFNAATPINAVTTAIPATIAPIPDSSPNNVIIPLNNPPSGPKKAS